MEVDVDIRVVVADVEVVIALPVVAMVLVDAVVLSSLRSFFQLLL